MNECGLGIEERRMVNRDKKYIMLIPMKSLEQMIKYIISEVLGKKAGIWSKNLSVNSSNSIWLSKSLPDR